MRFMIIRKGDAETEAGTLPTADLAEAMMRHHEEMGRELRILGGDGLKPTSAGARVKFRGGKPLVTDGPFTETKEIIAGYTLVEADSLEQVLAWARRWPILDGHGEVELEIRPLWEIEDFGDAFSPDLKAEAERIMGGS
ncbi:YciI family protein [Phenylobacterium sp.]|uniref:YciI family protein n=1 Tax=Phenylobacterium sp. TaxID=1871053 RepID=UPI0025FC8ADA|nr:YciI family protein [Phenylobacterium sp.]MBX3485984.1 YciI family protein [Phenylobacterium sp.]MCW5759974.1 YciI family protein [Phenylobacterium sp.]